LKKEGKPSAVPEDDKEMVIVHWNILNVLKEICEVTVNDPEKNWTHFIKYLFQKPAY